MEQPQAEIPDRLLTPTFAGFVLTQFLGAFNDNYFKQMVALTCVAQVAHGGADWQPFAMGPLHCRSYCCPVLRAIWRIDIPSSESSSYARWQKCW